MPVWCKALIDVALCGSGLAGGKVFRRVLKTGARQDAGVTTDVVWYAVKRYATRIGIDHLAPHDLRRTCARLCHSAGGELEQVQFLLGHASVQATERGSLSLPESCESAYRSCSQPEWPRRCERAAGNGK